MSKRALAIFSFILITGLSQTAAAADRAAAAPRYGYRRAPDLGHAPDLTGRLGIGAMVGVPFSFNAKYWVTREVAIEGGVGYGLLGLGGIEPYVEALYNFGPVFGNANEVASHMSFYLGGGMLFMFGNYGGIAGLGNVSATVFGVYVPLGITWMPPRARNWEFFAQVGPGVGFGSVGPSTYQQGNYTITNTKSIDVGGFLVVGGVGAHYYFD